MIFGNSRLKGAPLQQGLQNHVSASEHGFADPADRKGATTRQRRQFRVSVADTDLPTLP